MLTEQQRDEFERDGVVKLAGAFSADDAARMQAVVWGELRNKYGIERDDPTTWGLHLPTGLKNSKRHRAFDLILGPDLRATLDDLFAPDPWTPPKQWGNVLVTMPTPEPWRVPHRIWHSDFGYEPHRRQPFVVKVWALFDDVEPGGGGTPQLLGSHRITERWLADHPTEEREYKFVRDRILRSHPWLKALSSPDDSPDRNERCMVEGGDIDGIPVRVVECTGRAGDVYVTHPWVMHSIATNANAHPRLMRSAAIFRARA